MSFETVLLLVVVAFQVASASTYLEKNALMTDLLTGYNTDIRPVHDQSDTVDVVVKVTIYSVTDIDPIQGIVIVTAGFLYQWTDEMISWNASDYYGIQSVLLRQQQVWTPSAIVVSSLDQTYIGEANKDRVKFYSTGLASWSPVHILRLQCEFYMKFWPFDKQICILVIIAQDYTVNEMLIILDDPGIVTNHITMSEWTLEEAVVKARVPIYISFASYQLKFKRQSLFYVLTLICPIALIGILIPFVFLLPSESGERIGFSITIMLSLTVFLTVISDEIPRTSNPVALICGYVMMLLLSSVIVTVMTIINLRIHNRSDKRPIGMFWQIICRQRGNITNINKVHNVGMVLNRSNKAVVDMSNHEMKAIGIADIENEFHGNDTNVCRDEDNSSQLDDVEYSWQDISNIIDKYLFVITFAIVTCPSVVFICYLSMASDYYDMREE